MTTNAPSQPLPTHLAPSPRPYSPINSSTQLQTRSPTASTGSLSQTVNATTTPPTVLRLRGAHSPSHRSPSTSSHDRPSRRPRIQWADDVIDNEGLNRKKSKVCCIYHRPRAVGESSDESSSDSDSDSSGDDSGAEDGARPANGGGARSRGRRGHTHDDDCAHDHGHPSGSGSAKRRARDEAAGDKRQPSPNAYEKMPRYDVKPLTEQPQNSR